MGTANFPKAFVFADLSDCWNARRSCTDRSRELKTRARPDLLPESNLLQSSDASRTSPTSHFVYQVSHIGSGSSKPSVRPAKISQACARRTGMSRSSRIFVNRARSIGKLFPLAKRSGMYTRLLFQLFVQAAKQRIERQMQGTQRFALILNPTFRFTIPERVFTFRERRSPRWWSSLSGTAALCILVRSLRDRKTARECNCKHRRSFSTGRSASSWNPGPSVDRF